MEFGFRHGIKRKKVEKLIFIGISSFFYDKIGE
jgi:hypothetical protein